MVRKILALSLILLCGVVAWAAEMGSIQGKVVDASGAAVSNADITLTNTATGAVVHQTSDATGNFVLSGLRAGDYSLAASKSGFATKRLTNLHVQDGQVLTPSMSLVPGSVEQSVVVNAGLLAGATPEPTEDDIFNSDQSIRMIDRKAIDTTGPVSGAAQIIALTPGANVTGYGNTGATKYTIGVNGVSQGWGGYGGYTGGGALAITFDGVPVVDPATDLWQSPTIPQQFMIQNTNVTYGPGDAAERWYNNIGGGVEFTPVQPSAKPHADLSLTYGSYAQKNAAVVLSTGLYHGWASVVSGGVGSGNDFRVASDGFGNPSKDVAALGKTIRSFGDNSIELGGYYAHGAGYRSQVIPVVANPLITTNGLPGGQIYSQQTSGYYSTLPYNSYNKYDTNEMGLIYGRENIRLDDKTTLQNLSWFMHITRSHYRTDDVYNLGPQQDEWNSPHTDTVGDRLLVTKRLPFNTVSVGGYYVHALYNSRNNFYNPADGGAKRVVNAGGKIRSSYFNQDDFALMAQDEIRLNSIVQITPGIRYVGFTSGFYNAVQQDFTLASGATLSTTCRYGNFGGTKGTVNVQDACPAGNQNRSGVEPSVNGTVRALPWLEVYGGFMEALRAPQLGGGGGLFQSVDPASYHLSRQSYYQAGFKIHPEGTGALNSLLLGAAFYHQNWANQEIDTTLENGDTVSANGTSTYHGVNMYIDDDPIAKLHLFANGNVETSKYTNYVTIPAAGGQAALSYNGLYVPYVPVSTFNAGAFYDFTLKHGIHFLPTASFQYIGTQHLFDNSAQPQPIPSNRTMPGYGTMNLGFKVPIRFAEIQLNAINVFNSEYNEYEYISGGGYFGTFGNGTPAESAGYLMAYPGAPATVYGGVNFHF
jgi:iron complex outermembrane receptor protein